MTPHTGIAVNIVVESNNEDIKVKCIFCQKELDRSEMVRFRGAISCRECAKKQKPSSNPILKPFFYLAGFGCLIGMVTSIYFSFHVHFFANINPESYIQPIVELFGGMAVTIALMSLGLYAINRLHLFAASIVGLLMGTITAICNALAVYDFVVDGPYYVTETGIHTKTISYYPIPIVLISLFAIIAASSILLHMTNIRTEYVSLIAAGLLLFSSILVIPIMSWIVTGTLNALVYAAVFIFFMTRRRIYAEADIQSL